MQSNIIVTAVVVIYLLVMLLIGYLSSKKIESNTDFVVAGRRLGPLLMAGTLAATEIGGGSSCSAGYGKSRTQCRMVHYHNGICFCDPYIPCTKIPCCDG